MTMEGQNHYRVVWEIDIWADTPREAACEALNIQRNGESIATVFDVTDTATGILTREDLDDPSLDEHPGVTA
jgi:hypothetical protein